MYTEKDQMENNQLADKRTWLGIDNFMNVIASILNLLILLKRDYVLSLLTVLFTMGSIFYYSSPYISNLLMYRVPFSLMLTKAFLMMVPGVVSPTLMYIASVVSVMYWYYSSNMLYYMTHTVAPFMFISVSTETYLGYAFFMGASLLAQMHDKNVFMVTNGYISGVTLSIVLMICAFYFI